MQPDSAMTIDAHQHFWQFNPVRDAWMREGSMSAIRRDFLPADLQPLLTKCGIEACIAVQADQSETETEFLLELADRHAFIRGVVGWVDLRAKNLPASVRLGADKRLAAMPWNQQRALELRQGRSDGHDEVGVSHAFGGIAETGTLVMTSGPDNPSTINFLPEHHIVVVDVDEIDGDMEAVLARVRKKFGRGRMPRTLNFITGPSRSGDIEQKIVLGAHGPRALHIIIVGG